MAGVSAGEAADLDVVAHDVVFGREFVDGALEELLLVVPAGTPGEYAADIEVFADDVPHHIGRSDAFSGGFVVGAAGGVDVVIAGNPAEVGELDPALHAERFARFGCGGNSDGLLEIEVFGAAVVGNFVFAGREEDFFAVTAINLSVKEEVGGQATRLRWIDAVVRVAKHELAGGGCAVVVENGELHADCRLALEQNGDFISEADILRPLADVEADGGFALAAIATVDLHDTVFEIEARELRDERLAVEDLDVHPAIGNVFRFDGRFGIGAAGRAGVKWRGVGARRPQFSRDATFIVDFDQKDAPALLDELPRRNAASDFDAALGIDIHAGQAALVEDFLNGFDRVVGIGAGNGPVESGLLLFGQRLAEELQSLGDALNLRLERLSFNTAYDGKVVGKKN